MRQESRRLLGTAKTVAEPGCSVKRRYARHKMKYWEIIADKLSSLNEAQL